MARDESDTDRQKELEKLCDRIIRLRMQRSSNGTPPWLDECVVEWEIHKSHADEEELAPLLAVKLG